MSLRRIAEPAVSAVDANRIAARLNLCDSVQILDVSQTLAPPAVAMAEQYTRRAFITQDWQQEFKRWSSVLTLARPPLQQLLTFEYRDPDGVWTAVDSALYEVVTNGSFSEIRLLYGQTWPVHEASCYPVRATFRAGYGDAASDVPDVVELAVSMLVSQWFVYREDVTAQKLERVPNGFRALLDVIKVRMVPESDWLDNGDPDTTWRAPTPGAGVVT